MGIPQDLDTRTAPYWDTFFVTELEMKIDGNDKGRHAQITVDDLMSASIIITNQFVLVDAESPAKGQS